MTDYKALYEQQLAENEQLRASLQKTEKYWREHYEAGKYNLNVLLHDLDEDVDQDVYDGISFTHPNPEREGAEMILMYKNKMKDTLKHYPDRQTLKVENKQLKEEKVVMEEQIDRLEQYCINLQPTIPDAHDVFKKITGVVSQ